MSRILVSPEIEIEPESVTLLGITTQYLRIRNGSMYIKIEMDGEDIKKIVEFWEDTYSLALKSAYNRIHDLEQCVRTMKTVK